VALPGETLEGAMNATETTTDATVYENATLYFRGGAGNFVKVKAKWIRVRIAPYAQYANAVHVTYVEKGKRRERGFVLSYKPEAVIAAGHDTPDPDGLYTPIYETADVTVSKGRYMSASEGWTKDFVSGVLPRLNVLANFIGHNSGENARIGF
jgi:hypothetical protein